MSLHPHPRTRTHLHLIAIQVQPNQPGYHLHDSWTSRRVIREFLTLIERKNHDPYLIVPIEGSTKRAIDWDLSVGGDVYKD